MIPDPFSPCINQHSGIIQNPFENPFKNPLQYLKRKTQKLPEQNQVKQTGTL
jgi:hypothetical protein